MPPQSVMNGLKLNQTDKELEEQGLSMEELEAALIARNIVFEKVFVHHTSGWTKLKDKIINVPVSEKSIVNTMQQMPRTPEEACLLNVSLKRQIAKKGEYLKQLIRPKRLFDVLAKLKENNTLQAFFASSKYSWSQYCAVSILSTKISRNPEIYFVLILYHPGMG